MKKAWIPFVASVMGMIAFASCSKKETKSYSNLMFINASPSVSSTTIISDESVPYTSPLAYGMNTNYIQVEAGNGRVIRMHVKDTTYLSTTLSAPADQYLSAFLVDTGTKTNLMVIGDNLGSSRDRAKLRFINLSPNAVPVDLTIAKTVDTIFRGQAFKQASGFNEFIPGVYKLVVSRTGTKDTVCTAPIFSMSAGKVYTLYLKGYDSSNNGKTGVSTSLIQHN